MKETLKEVLVNTIEVYEKALERYDYVGAKELSVIILNITQALYYATESKEK